MSKNVLLEMKHIHKRFAGVHALNDISLELHAGEVHALLGENGAGKSTLIKVLGGIYSADEGGIWIDGKKVEIKGVKDAQDNGIAIIHQELVLVPHMTVAENIFLGREFGSGFLINRAKMNEEAQKLLDANQVHIKADTLVGKLTIAQQQMVEIVKAISYNSRILVMDEPTSSIADKEVEFLFETMRKLAKQGVGIIYISHKMSELEEICDRVTVMRDGEYVGTKVVKETNKDELIAMMVGRELTSYYTREYQEPGEEILRCEHISDGNMVRDVSFNLHKGEIIGFAGLVGAGRSETMKAIFGLTKGAKGDIYLKGKKTKISSPVEAMKNGIALVPENRKEEGLYKVQSVRFNMTIEIMDQFIKGIRVNEKKEIEITQKYIDMMSTKTPTQLQKIGNLSGGNQQKVIIGRWLATNPDVLIMDEPTRGIDVGAKYEIYELIINMAKQGKTIIVVSSEMPEILGITNRIGVMSNGHLSGIVNTKETNQEELLRLSAKYL